MDDSLLAIAGGLALVGLGIGGCGDDLADTCHNRIPMGATCETASIFAARSAVGITPTDEDVDLHYVQWDSIVEAEPIVGSRLPQSYRNPNWNQLMVYTSNANVIEAWKNQHLLVGNAEFDSTISALVRPSLHTFNHDNGDGSWYFLLNVEGTYSEENLHAALMRSDSWLPDRSTHSGDDGMWSQIVSGPNAGKARVDFRFGWGDCLVSCEGYHSVVAVVSEDGEAVVYDAGGDPLPPTLQLAETTRPISELPQ